MKRRTCNTATNWTLSRDFKPRILSCIAIITTLVGSSAPRFTTAHEHVTRQSFDVVDASNTLERGARRALTNYLRVNIGRFGSNRKTRVHWGRPPGEVFRYNAVKGWGFGTEIRPGKRSACRGNERRVQITKVYSD